MCRCVKFGQVFPLYLSSAVLTLMAVDRVGVTSCGAATNVVARAGGGGGGFGGVLGKPGAGGGGGGAYGGGGRYLNGSRRFVCGDESGKRGFR